LDDRGQVIGLTVLGWDITEGKQAEMALRRTTTERPQAERAAQESENRFETMAEAAPVLMWASGPDKLCSYFNQVWLDFTGRTLQEELGNGWIEGVHPEDRSQCLETYHASFDARQRFRMEYRLCRHDGQYRWILDSGSPRYHAGGSFAGYVGAGFDVTDRKRAREELKEKEERYRSLFEGMTEGFALHEIVCDQSGTPCDYRFLEVNPSFERLTRLRREDVVGRLQSEVLPREDPRWMRDYGRVALTGESCRFENYSRVLQKHYEVFCYHCHPVRPVSSRWKMLNVRKIRRNGPVIDLSKNVTTQVLFEGWGKNGRPSRARPRYSSTGRPCLRSVPM
jgi:PAS domain S-box-containing protein